MESLHAPWRIEYILAPKPSREESASLFSRIARSHNDIEDHVIRREYTCFALLNTFPYNGGHLLVVPNREVADLNELTESELLDLMLLTRRCKDALTAVMRPDGFNIGLNLGRTAGAGIENHLHWHIVPRWHGDTNFMPVLSGTHVLPEALADVAAKLRQAMNT